MFAWIIFAFLPRPSTIVILFKPMPVLFGLKYSKASDEY
jgi:hypothetical protein